LATAIELSRAGAQVWLTGRTPEKTTAAAASIGDRVTGCAVDARDAAKLEAFFARVGEFNHLIVALGGGSAIGAFKDLDEAKMRAGFDNKFWPYLMARIVTTIAVYDDFCHARDLLHCGAPSPSPSGEHIRLTGCRRFRLRSVLRAGTAHIAFGESASAAFAIAPHS